MTAWIAICRDSAGVMAYAMDGARHLRHARGRDEAAARAHLAYDAARILHIGDGPPDTLPAAILPRGGRGLPGLTQTSPPDIISARVRLWIAGLLHTHRDWDGVVCAIDGDISHWLHLSASEAVSAQSFLTPRLMTALGGAAPPCPLALGDSLSRPERLAAHLRAAEISDRGSALAGHLLGAELAAARPYWLGQQVAVVTERDDPTGHAAALTAQGVPARVHPPAELVAPGLAALAGALGLGA